MSMFIYLSKRMLVFTGAAFQGWICRRCDSCGSLFFFTGATRYSWIHRRCDACVPCIYVHLYMSMLIYLSERMLVFTGATFHGWICRRCDSCGSLLFFTGATRYSWIHRRCDACVPCIYVHLYMSMLIYLSKRMLVITGAAFHGWICRRCDARFEESRQAHGDRGKEWIYREKERN